LYKRNNLIDMKKIKNLDELDEIKLKDENKHEQIKVRYFKNCIIEKVFDTEWAEEADEHILYYNIGVGEELEEFNIELYCEPMWDSEIRGALKYSNFSVLGVFDREGEELTCEQDLEDLIIKNI